MQSSVEVTHEDFFSHHRSQQQQQQQQQHNRKTFSHSLKKHNGHSTATTTTSRPPKRALAGFKKLWSSQRKRNNTPSLMEQQQQQQQQRLLHQEQHDTADESVSSDQARNGESGPSRLSSLQTVASVDDTVKASNHAQHHPTPLVMEKPGPVTRKRSGWGKLKNRLFKRTDAIPEEDNDDDDHDDRPEMVLLQRARSSPERSSTGQQQQQQQQQHDLDDAIKGRLDGMDVLSLGPCRLGLKRKFSRKEEGLARFVETMCPRLTTRSLVMDMVRTSAGRDPPELVLEGFFPGGDDRWIVRIVEEQAKQPPQPPQQETRRRSESPLPPSLTPTEDDDDDDEDCSVVCGGEDDLQLLLESMWGKHEAPPPSHVAKSHSSDSGDSEDDVLQLAAACSVPIDIDEDTFIVDTANHLQSIHDIASVPLRKGNFVKALVVFEKILKGLELRHEGKPHYLMGVTLHNIGMICVWCGRLGEALDRFGAAVRVRRRTLPADHADLAVSLVRKATVEFGLGHHAQALRDLGEALAGRKKENTTRAKILNNLGVVHYHREDFVEAMNCFAKALQIQRRWLAGPVKRESVVYDASVSLANMGKVYLQKKDVDTALHVLEESLLLQTSFFRRDSGLVLRSMDNLAYAKALHREYKRSIQMYRGILGMQQKPQGMEVVGILGHLYVLHKKDEEALKCLTAVYKWQLGHLDPHHPCVKHTKETIKGIEERIQGAVSVWI